LSYSCCTADDFEKVSIGQELKINGRYENLRLENGQNFEYVARKDDIVVVQRKTKLGLIVLFYEDTVRLNTSRRENYGEFLVEYIHIQKFD
jgi:hypothetical protein